MIEFQPVTLQDKDTIQAFYQSRYITSSENNFTTLYIWQKQYNIQYAVIAGCLVLKFKDNGFPPSLRFPIGDGDVKQAAIEACRHFIEMGEVPRFYGMTEDLKNQLVQLFPDEFLVAPMEDYFDYVYEAQRLITLSGKKLHSKKNHLNSFKKQYDYSFSPITKEDEALIVSQYADWFSTDDVYLLSEQESIGNLLRNFDKLDIFGGKLMVQDRLCAFTIAERLNSDTVVVHIEKADTAYKGAYAAINQMFAEEYLADYTYINREEDCGIEGLRKAKQSYHPDMFIKKYKAVLKEGVIL